MAPLLMEVEEHPLNPLLVYVGGTASLSFLQFLRRTIRQQMGPSSFTENSRRNQMLEVSSPEDTHINLEENPGQRRELIDVFLAAVRTI